MHALGLIRTSVHRLVREHRSTTCVLLERTNILVGFLFFFRLFFFGCVLVGFFFLFSWMPLDWWICLHRLHDVDGRALSRHACCSTSHAIFLPLPTHATIASSIRGATCTCPFASAITTTSGAFLPSSLGWFRSRRNSSGVDLVSSTCRMSCWFSSTTFFRVHVRDEHEDARRNCTTARGASKQDGEGRIAWKTAPKRRTHVDARRMRRVGRMEREAERDEGKGPRKTITSLTEVMRMRRRVRNDVGIDRVPCKNDTDQDERDACQARNETMDVQRRCG